MTGLTTKLLAMFLLAAALATPSSCSPPSPPSKVEDEETQDDDPSPNSEKPDEKIKVKYTVEVISASPPPSPRSGFMLASSIEDEVVLVGGISKTEEERSVAVLNRKKNTWTSVATPPEAPGRFYSSLSVSSDGSLFAWGGARFVNLTKTRGSRLDDGYILKGSFIAHVKAAEISSPAPSPSPRSGHCMVGFESGGSNFVFMYGGENHGTFLSDAWIFELGTKLWTRVDEAGGWPARREAHQCFKSADRAKIIVHGGVGEAGPKSDVWTYDIEKRTFESTRADSPVDSRLNPCVSMSQDGLLLVYGGSSPSLRLDGYVFDTVRKKEIPVTKGSAATWPGSCVTKNGETGALGPMGHGEWILSSISKDDKGHLYRDLWEAKITGGQIIFEKIDHGLASTLVIGRVATAAGTSRVIFWGGGDPNIDSDNTPEGIVVEKRK